MTQILIINDKEFEIPDEVAELILIISLVGREPQDPIQEIIH